MIRDKIYPTISPSKTHSSLLGQLVHITGLELSPIFALDIFISLHVYIYHPYSQTRNQKVFRYCKNQTMEQTLDYSQNTYFYKHLLTKTIETASQINL